MFLGNSKKILNKLNEGYQNIEQNYFIMNQNIEKYLLNIQKNKFVFSIANLNINLTANYYFYQKFNKRFLFSANANNSILNYKIITKIHSWIFDQRIFISDCGHLSQTRNIPKNGIKLNMILLVLMIL